MRSRSEVAIGLFQVDERDSLTRNHLGREDTIPLVDCCAVDFELLKLDVLLVVCCLRRNFDCLSLELRGGEVILLSLRILLCDLLIFDCFIEGC